MYVMRTWALPLIESINPSLDYGIFPFTANELEENLVLGGVVPGFLCARRLVSIFNYVHRVHERHNLKE